MNISRKNIIIDCAFRIGKYVNKNEPIVKIMQHMSGLTLDDLEKKPKEFQIFSDGDGSKKIYILYFNNSNNNVLFFGIIYGNLCTIINHDDRIS